MLFRSEHTFRWGILLNLVGILSSVGMLVVATMVLFTHESDSQAEITKTRKEEQQKEWDKLVGL